MTALIEFLFTGIPALFQFFFAMYARKWGTAIAAVAASLAMLILFIACINKILAAIVALIAMPTWLLESVGMLIPGNFSAVLSFIVSGRICRAAWDYSREKVDLITKAN